MPFLRRTATIVEGLMREFAEQKHLTDLDSNQLFETFSAYCVTSQYRVEFEPDDLRCGCQSDRGIDAYGVIIGGVLYTHAEDVRQAVNAAAQVDTQFVIVQAKRQRAVDGGVFGSLATSIANIFGYDPLTRPFSPGVENLRDCARAAYSVPQKFVNGSPVLRVWYTNLGNFREGNHKDNMVAASRNLVKTKLFREVELRGAGAQDLRSLYRDAESTATVTVSMSSQVDLPPIEGVARAVFGVMRARDVVERILTVGKEKRPYLYHSNLREYLDKTQVNQGIERTLQEPAQCGQFSVLNNGITIVAKKLTPAGKDLVLTDPQIINGCQTCNILLDNREFLSDAVTVTVRVIESGDRKFIDRIIAATNTQNVLGPYAAEALDHMHGLLEDYFLAQSLPRKLYYERRQKQYGADIARSRIVTRRQLTQSYASMWLGDAHRATRFVSLQAARKDDLYRQGHDPLPYYTAAAVHHRLAWLFGRGEGAGVPSAYREARFHLLSGVKLYLVGDTDLPKAEKATATMCNTILDAMWHPTDGRDVVLALLPAIRTALGTEVTSAALAQAVRTELFGERFHEAVLNIAGGHRAAA